MRHIYKITNLLTGKIYIGQSKRFKRRKEEHINGFLWTRTDREVTQLSLDIYLYGVENFVFEILKECPTKIEANAAESFYISHFNSLVPNGYNIRGSEFSIDEMSDNTKEKLSKIGQGIRHAKNKEEFESDFIGVIKSLNKFRACVRIKRKIKTKTFNTEEEAAEAYDKMVLFLYGEGARLNFPEKKGSYLSCDLQAFFNFFTTHSIPKISQYKWISVSKKTGKWTVKIFDPKNIVPSLRLGSFANEILAAETADKIRFYYFPDSPISKYNFPEKIPQYSDENLEEFFKSKLLTKQSIYEGVVKTKDGNRWRAYYYLNRKQINVGAFDSEEEANKARQEAILKLDHI